MAITQALQFDQTPNRMLYEIGQQARQDQLMQQKLQRDNMEKQYQILQEVNPATLYPKFEKEIVDQTIGDLTNGMSEFLKANPNASYVDLQGKVNKSLSKIAEWSARVKGVKDSIDKNIGTMAADAPYDRGRLRALAIDRALYKVDENGRKVIKSPEEINLEEDYLGSVISTDEDKVIDPFKGQENAFKLVKDAPLLTLDDTKTVETPDGKKTTKTGTVSNLPFYLQNKDGRVAIRQGDDGYIDETVYGTFYSNPATKAWINAGAKDTMRKLGVPESPEATEWFRRSYLTNWLETQSKGQLKKINDTTYSTPTTVVNIGQTGPGVEKGRIAAYDTLISALKSNEDPMTSTKVDNNIKNAVLTIADENGVFRAANIKAVPSMLKVKIADDGSVGIYNKRTGELIAAVSQQSFDQRVNEVAGGKFVQSATVQGEPDPVKSGIDWKK
jgi:hypothetical protein